MPKEVLEQLGFSPNEAKIYEALLDLKEAGVGAISFKTKLQRRNIYDTLRRLVDKGFVFPVLSEGEKLYSPADPDKLMELIKEKERLLKSALPELKTLYQKQEPPQEAFVYQGIEGIKNYMFDILRVGKNAYTIGAKLGLFDPRIKDLRERFLKEAKRKKIKFYCIFDAEVKEKGQDILEHLGLDKPYRFLPPQYSTDSAIDIFGDYVVTYNGLQFKKIKDDVTILVLRNKRLAESYRTWFHFMFDNYPQLQK